jgi:hypothetical protein
MNTETLIASEPGQSANGVSERKRAANRANSGKSTGPTSKMGKRIASLNSFKNGYYSNERRLQLMAELDEDPGERERLRQDLYATYPPGAPLEGILLDGLTDDFWRRGQLDRLDASVKLRELQRAQQTELQREERRESNALGATGAEVEKGGLIRLEDSAGKFEMILSLLEDLLDRAERRQLSRDQQGLWEAVYGTSERNWYAEWKFALLEAGKTLDKEDWDSLTDYLKEEIACYRRSQARFLAQYQEQTVAEREARLVTCGGDALILFKEMEVTDRHIDRKLQLLLKVRAERFAREKEERRQEEEGSKQQADDGPKEEESSRRKAEGSPNNRDDDHGGPKGEESSRRKAEGSPNNRDDDHGAPKEEESSRRKAEGSPNNRDDDPDGNAGGGSAKIPPPKPVQGAAAERRETVAQGASPGAGEPSPETFDLQPSTLDFSKNEATDLLENKGSAPAKIGNEATVEGSRHSPQAADPATSLGGQPADCVLPTALYLLLSLLRLPSVFLALVWVLRRQAAGQIVRRRTFDLQPSTFDSSDCLLPRAENGSHQDEPHQRVTFVDGEQLYGTHLVHGGGVGDRSDKANPHQTANGSALDGGTGVAPLDELRQHQGDEQVQHKGDDVGQSGVHVASLGKMLEGHPGLAEQRCVPETSQQPIGRRGDDHRQVIRFHVPPTSGQIVHIELPSALRAGRIVAQSIFEGVSCRKPKTGRYQRSRLGIGRGRLGFQGFVLRTPNPARIVTVFVKPKLCTD